MRDKKEAKSGIVNIQVKAIFDQKLRMDILSPIQTHIASVALKGDELSYLIVAEKRGYRGMSSPAAMMPVLRIPLDPKLLYNVFFDKPIADKNWSCTEDEKGMPKECKQLRGGMKITWTSREGVKRILEIDHPKAFLQINIHSFDGSVKADDPKFDLKIPDSFKLI